MPRGKQNKSTSHNALGQSLFGGNIAPTYISLFSSAGVGCYGFKLEGFRCIATIELLKERIEVQRANHKCEYESGYICGDITKPEIKNQLLNEISAWHNFGSIENVDVVFATPPCQGMSTANYKKSDNEQVRNSLVVEAIKLILQIRPKVFIFENVRAFMTTICTDVDGTDKSIGESIYKNLGEDYHIYHKVINFMDFGVPSSRPRTLVIGTLKSIRNISPLNLFPIRQAQITLRQAIGQFPHLEYGESSSTDVYHFARKFPLYQKEWIENLKEGESAFKQQDKSRHPYKLSSEGNRIPLKGAYMGNKYRRLFWDKPCACIATRNDQLASQDTIHPTDDRVLSIRELMHLMTIPDSFVWSKEEIGITTDKFQRYLMNHELNIRRCIGESVPTYIIEQIAQKIKEMLEFEHFINSYDPHKDYSSLIGAEDINFYIDTFLQEQGIKNAKDTGSFYTPQCVVFDTIRSIEIDNKVVRILEPSVGLGAFIPQLCTLFSNADRIIIDAVEIDETVIEHLEKALRKLNLGSNVEINFHHSDFLKFNITHHYDLIASNPPYAKASESYRQILGLQHKTKNLFALFLIKFLGLADNIACVIPKNFVIADEFQSIRYEYENIPIVRICDFGVKFFKNVFVEIISIHFCKTFSKDTEVIDYINERIYVHPQKYIFHDKLWLLYRNAWFDDYIKGLILDVFNFFRDRQITNAKISNTGKFRVLRSKNILDDGSIVEIEGYDKFVDDQTQFSVSKFLNSNCLIMPNFTYNTRVTRLPANTIPNGSIAILIPKKDIKNIDLRLYSTKEFRLYYSIVKSFSKFTLNIDNCSIYYIGIKHDTV